MHTAMQWRKHEHSSKERRPLRTLLVMSSEAVHARAQKGCTSSPVML